MPPPKLRCRDSGDTYRTPIRTPLFVDNGYGDMFGLKQVLHEGDFRGVVIADHVPFMVGGPRAAWAYGIGRPGEFGLHGADCELSVDNF